MKYGSQSVSVPSDYILLSFDESVSAKSRIKYTLTMGPPGLANAQNRRPYDYLSREEIIRLPSHKLDEIGAERKRKDMDQYQSLQIEMEPDTLLSFVRDLRSAGLIKCGEIYA